MSGIVDIQIEEKQLPIIRGNFEAVKVFIDNQLKKYETLIVTEENLKDSKEVQKELASLRTKIDDYRKNIKQELLVPITEFESKCKELIDIVVKVERPIKIGIEVFNDKVRQEKLNYANEIIDAHCTNFGLNRENFKILDSFTNLSGTRKSIEQELDKQAQDLIKIKEQKEKNIELIKEQIEQLNSTFELEVPICFTEIEKKITNDNFMELSQFLLGEANKRKQTQEKIREQIIQNQQKQVEESKKKEEQIKTEEQAAITEQVNVVVDEETGEIIEKLSIVLKLTGTLEELKALKEYITLSGITYEKIKL